MQRRRQQTPQNDTAPFLSPTSTTAALNTNSNSTTLASARSNHSSAPSASFMTGGIELRDRPAHGTSSSLSGVYQRAPSAATDAYQPPSYRIATPAVSDTIFIMKPIVSAVQAWSCFVISIFAIIILSTLGLLFKNNHHEMVGGIEDPKDGPQVAATVFVAVLVYAGFLVFCGLQGVLHMRENRRGAIAL